MGNGQFNPAEWKFVTPAYVHWVSFCTPCLTITNQFIRRYYWGIAFLAYINSIPQMVCMTVGYKDCVNIYIIRLYLCCRIAVQERVNYYAVLASFCNKARMSVICEFHRITSL